MLHRRYRQMIRQVVRKGACIGKLHLLATVNCSPLLTKLEHHTMCHQQDLLQLKS
jgi:hypothetical protein